MKDLSWTGGMPETWEAIPLKSMFDLGKGLSITKEDLVEDGVPVLSYGQIHSKSNPKVSIPDALVRYVPPTIADSAPNSLAVRNGFVFADTSEDLDGCGNCNYVDRDDVYGGYHTVILKPKTSIKTDNKYLSYLFQTDAWRYQLRKELTEVKLYSVSQKALKSTWIIMPPHDEKDAIVRYLDAKCSAIDEAIQRHKKIIEKLEEYKTDVITHLILGRDREDITDSQIEWMGKISASRHVWRMKHLLYRPLKYGANESGLSYSETLPRYIRITDIDQNGLLKDTGKVSLSEEQADGYILRDGTVLFARSGATVGKTFLYKSEYGRAAFAGYLIAAIPNEAMLLPKWLKYYTECISYANWKDVIFTQATIQNIGADKYADLPIPICSIQEQKQVINRLDIITAEVKSTVSKHYSIIEKLEEYRKSIIYNAVTGKTDCRTEV